MTDTNNTQSKSKDQVVRDAEAFADFAGMPDRASLFGKAALVARNPELIETIPQLDEGERAALVYERDHKWHGSKMLWYSISLCAIGAATQGWDQTGSNGANLSFPEEFGLTGQGRDEWIVGIINAVSIFVSYVFRVLIVCQIIFLTAGLMSVYIHCGFLVNLLTSPSLVVPLLSIR